MGNNITKDIVILIDTKIVDRDNVWMIEAGRDMSFGQKLALNVLSAGGASSRVIQQYFANSFERNPAINRDLLGREYFAHSAFADKSAQAVVDLSI